MTTVVELSPDELSALQELTNESEPAAAVRAAMQEFLRHARRQQLKSLSGRVVMQDNWAELEQAELDAADENARPSAD